MPLECQVYCVGANNIIDLTDYPEEEQLVTEAYQTVCVRRFCGKHPKCIYCEHYYIPTKDEVNNASKKTEYRNSEQEYGE